VTVGRVCMFARSKSRIGAGFVVVGVIAGSSLLAATPANAAPGDASAVGASAVVALDLPIIGFNADAAVGSVAVAAPGTAGFDEDGVTLLDAALADITLGAVTTSATSSAAGSEGSAQIADADVSLFGLDILTLDTATATATCPTGGTPTAVADVAGLTILGGAATVDAGDPVDATVALGADFGGAGGVDLTGVDLTVTVDQVETVTAGGATAIALVAVVTLDGTAGVNVFDDEVVATVTLASATCETPAVVAVTATAITPNVGPTTGGQTVTITGTGFTPATTVTIGGTPATGVVVNAEGTSITAVTPAGAEGATTAVIANPGSAATLPYTYVEPDVASISPTSGPEYGGTIVTITGAGLGTTTGVEFGGEPAVIQSVSPDGTSVVVTSPAGEGSVDVTLTLAGGSTLTADEDFVYVAPIVSDVSPGSGPTAGGTTVTIVGEGLGGTTGVLFGDNPGTIVGTPTDTQVVVTSPAGTVGAVDVTVQLPGGVIVVPDGFTYVAAPVIDSVTPGSGSTAGGTVVVVVGSGFVPGGTTVTVCGVVLPATQVTVNAAGTQLQFSTPACDAGTVPLVVTTAGGASGPADFRYVQAVAPVVGGNGAGNGSGSGFTGPLANTGGDTSPLIGWAVTLLLAGLIAGATQIIRRRAA
jgi:hypothetical protein